jgi:hypothetical protein
LFEEHVEFQSPDDAFSAEQSQRNPFILQLVKGSRRFAGWTTRRWNGNAESYLIG